MKLYLIYTIVIIILTNCICVSIQRKKNIEPLCSWNQQKKNYFNQKKIIKLSKIYDPHIYRCSRMYGVDAALIKAIIQVESNYNPNVVSKSNAIGLMQIKADTAGKDAYKLKGWPGKPSILDLKNAVINIEIGTVYLSILQNQLKDIVDLDIRRYAVIVAYVNGLGALLRVFSKNKVHAIEKINKFDAEQFYKYIQSHHPSIQARHYLYKVNSFYVLEK